MRAGRLDRLITIEQPTTTEDAHGQPIPSWSTYTTAWSDKKEKPGAEYFAAGQEISEQVVVFTIRYYSGITTKMRISYNSKYYDIVGFRELGRAEGLELVAVVQGE